MKTNKLTTKSYNKNDNNNNYNKYETNKQAKKQKHNKIEIKPEMDE